MGIINQTPFIYNFVAGDPDAISAFQFRPELISKFTTLNNSGFRHITFHEYKLIFFDMYQFAEFFINQFEFLLGWFHA
jgi:hypothetical protein